VDGLVLERDVLSAVTEAALIDFVRGISFGEVRMHGVTAKRRVAQFGWRYAFESFRLTPGPPIPEEFHDARSRAGIVAGVSLGAACRMRFRRGQARNWETAAVELPPRSIYLLTGSTRREWQHMIPPVAALRWSITFRTLCAARGAG